MAQMFLAPQFTQNNKLLKQVANKDRETDFTSYQHYRHRCAVQPEICTSEQDEAVH
jgi:hypothetical protein